MSDNRRIYEDQPYVHFVTFSCDHRRKLLDHDHPKRILLGKLNQQLRLQQAKCVGFVLMPEHVHALLWLNEPGQLSHFMHEWKRLSSLDILKWYQKNNFHYFKKAVRSDRFWTPKFYSFEIYSQKKLQEKLQYMHLNPVRAGYVEKTVEWKWGSARWYEQGRSVGVPIHWVE